MNNWWENSSDIFHKNLNASPMPFSWKKRYAFSVEWFLRHKAYWDKYIAEWFSFRKPRRLIEIGCYQGMSTIWILETLNYLNIYDFQLICIDPWYGIDGEFGVFTKNIEQTGCDDNVVVYRDTSMNVLHKYNNADFIYIDGSHESYPVFYDAIESYNKLDSGGLMIFDDYYHPENSTSDILNTMKNVRTGIDAAFRVLGKQKHRLGECVYHVKE